MRSAGLFKWTALLLIGVCLLMVGMLVYHSHQRTQRLLVMISAAKGSAETEPAGPAWLNRLLELAGIGRMQRIVSARFPDDYLNTDEAVPTPTTRRQAAEERAAKTAVKLIIPLIFFIFPAIFIVLTGPAALNLYRTFTSGALSK